MRQVRIGSEARSTDAWVIKKGLNGGTASKADPSPGPGDYLNQTHNTIGQSSIKGGYMAQKYKTKIESKPGPGEYNLDSKAVRQSSPQYRVSKAERQTDIFDAK